MTSTTTVRSVLSVAIVTAGFALLTADALAQRRWPESVNTPVAHANSYNCFVDKGYGRWTNCDQSDGGSARDGSGDRVEGRAASLAEIAAGEGKCAEPLRARDLPTTAEIFQAGVDQAVRELANESHLRRLTPQQRRARVEFVFGNMLFVTIHELGHALVSQLDLLVLGREEDAADAYATLGALKCGSDFSHRVLVEAAKGWFMTAQRDRMAGDVPRYYDRHGLDEQRAYQIVCLMVGSDPVKFKDLADETGLPEDRRRSCGWDYDIASRSWERALAPHQRAADQPKARIEVIYGEGKGKLALYARIFSAARFLETIVEQVADRFAWPAPMVVEMRSCGEPNARWTIPTRRLHVCYELVQEFVELYRGYGEGRKLAGARVTPKYQLNTGSRSRPQSIGAWKKLRGYKLGRGSARYAMPS